MSSNLFCFKHPQYRGEGSPVISCSTCCSLYIDRIRAQRQKQTDKPLDSTKAWIEEKKHEAMTAYARKNGNSSPVFVPVVPSKS